MSNIILHISDLHVSFYIKPNGNINEKLNSSLNTNSDETGSNHFINLFIKKVKDEFPDSTFTLLITGDIADSGEQKEYDFAEKFIKTIMADLNIVPARVLMIPGDHDVCRRLLDYELADRPTDQSHLLNEVKYRNFSNFYRKIKGIDFPINKTIVEHIVLDSKIVLIGINSNYKINNEGGLGYIDVELFKTEVIELKKTLDDPELNFIACWHHNITAGYENSNSGQWDPDNRKYLIAELENQSIKLVLSGNEHINDSKGILGDVIMTSDCGAFSAIKSEATFKAYPILLTRDIKLENKIFALVRTGHNDRDTFWVHRLNRDAFQQESYDLFVDNNQKIEEVVVLPESTDDEKEVTHVEEQVEEAKVFYGNQQISDKLYSIVKEEKLFHTGHFHWSETSRAHNWIDVSKMLESHENLYFAQNAIIDVITTFNLAQDCNLIIGLGYEGNIISSKASIKFEIPYTSLPYSYRYNDHHDYEKKLNFQNDSGLFKTVIIITDVVNDGRTIRKLVKKREKKFFEKVERIIVISLFYTGQEAIDIGILNLDTGKISENYDIENDHEVDTIEFYTVKSLRVEKCPYGKDFREECFIYKDQLNCVHLFYDEESRIQAALKAAGS